MFAIRFFPLLFFFVPVSAQNLLMNGGFEDENICTEFIKNCAPEGWLSTSLRSDYYFDDVKHAYEGQHFVGLVASSAYKKPHFYLRSRLLCKMRPGAKYLLSFCIRSVHPVLDSIGIYFSTVDILYQKNGMKDILPQLWVKDVLISGNPKSWKKISFVYTAAGTENFIVIGNFKKEAYKYSGQPDRGIDDYFFMDDFSLLPENPAEKICSDAERIREEEYARDERHGLLEKKVYYYSKNPPAIDTAAFTRLQKVDTLMIPDVLFATNSYLLAANASRLLDSFVKDAPAFHIDSVVVEGHTDSMGSPSFNQKLSENRALSVAGYLRPYFTAPVISRGWAGRKPFADNRTTEGRKKNRRVEIYVYLRE